MKAAKAALLVVALIVLAGVFVWNYQQRNDPAFIINRIERGGDIPVTRLNELGERGKLDAYSDRLGELLASKLEAEWKPAIAAYAPTVNMDRLSKPTTRADTGLPASERIQRLAEIFFLSDPKTNANEDTWRRVGQAAIHLHIQSEVEYDASRYLPVTIVIYNAIDGSNDEPHGLTFGLWVDEIRINGDRADSAIEEYFGSPLEFVLADRSGFPSSKRHGMRRPYFLWQEDWISGNEAATLSVAVDARIEFLDGERVVQAWAETLREEMCVKLGQAR